MKLSEMNDKVKSFLELVLTPVNVKRKEGGEYVVTNTTTKEDLGNFSDITALKTFLGSVGATTLPDELDNATVDLDIPCEAIKMEMLKKE